jgi:Fungal trichothecene efflux pump (TRI12)
MAPVLIFLLPSKNPNPGVSIVSRFRRYDWIGVFLVTSGLSLFIIAIGFGGNQYAWDSGLIIGFFVASGILLILFGLSQTIMPGQTKEKRLFPIQYFLRKDMLLLAIATGAGTCGMCTFPCCHELIIVVAIYYIPLFFQFTRGDTAIKAAVRLLPLIILAVFFTVAGGAALSMTGYYTPWYIFGGIMVIIGYSLMHTITPETSDSKIYGYLVIVGTGVGCYVNFGFSVAQAITPKDEAEGAISFIMQGQLLGIVVGFAIAGSVFITHATEELTALLPNVPAQAVKDAIAGTDGGLLASLPPTLQSEALAIIVSCIDRVYILGITAGAVTFLCGIFLTHKKLDMKGTAGMA